MLFDTHVTDTQSEKYLLQQRGKQKGNMLKEQNCDMLLFSLCVVSFDGLIAREARFVKEHLADALTTKSYSWDGCKLT